MFNQQARSTQCPALVLFFVFQAIVNRRSYFLFSLSLPIELLRRSRKEHIAAAVDGGFDGVLNDADEETDSYRRHGDIIVDVHVVAKYL